MLLTVVIPTRNRPAALKRLLASLRAQTLPPDQFEVVVVDDGSEPPFAARPDDVCLPFPVRLLRREDDHGAHQSRRDGVQTAGSGRVLFLDDDVVAEPPVLAAHAAAGDRAIPVALGPIRYAPAALGTPYLRYMARFYERCVRSLADGRWRRGEFYACNASAPAALWRALFDDVSLSYRGPVAGDGADEHLIGMALARRGIDGQFLPAALVWHHDTRTLREARRDRRQAGVAECRVLVEATTLRPFNPLHVLLTASTLDARWRRLLLRLFWTAPSLFRVPAAILGQLAERGPGGIIPGWTCDLPLRVAYWEGVRTAAPSFGRLEAALHRDPVGR